MTIMEPDTQRANVPTAPMWLGAAGALPFVFSAICAVLGWQPFGLLPSAVAEAYGATILSFMGAIHWGLQMARRAPNLDWALYGASVLPALLAAAALMMPMPFSLLVLSGGLVALLVFDLCLAPKGLVPLWYGRLRWPLTIAAAASLLVVASV